MKAHQLGQILWNYLCLGARLDKREAIVVFGGHDLRVADWAAQLWLDGFAPLLVLSGGLGYYTSQIWSEPESHKFRRVAVDKGVDSSAIFVEDKSRNSGENVKFTQELLAVKGVQLRRAICVQKPYLELRVHATLTKQWPDCDFVLSSPPIPYERYAQVDIIDRTKLINELVGQVDRVEKYSQMGFTDRVEVPTDVIKAKRQLMELGFVKHLVSESCADA